MKNNFEKTLLINSDTKIVKKDYLIQFIPQDLKNITTDKNIFYKDKKLKTSYLIDIVHNLILKYYFKKENLFILNSTILKDKYGHLYNYYIEFLKENNIIRMEKNYFVGKNSRHYSLTSSILMLPIERGKNRDKILLKKYNMRFNIFEGTSDYIPNDIKNKLINDLYSVSLQYQKSVFFLENLKNSNYSIFNHNMYSVESINEKHIFFNFDHYGRMHSNFTILKSFIRKNCLLIDNEETCEVDIQNSQPLFLFKLIKDIKSAWVDSDELNLFEILVKNGNFYQYLVDKLELQDKKESKNITYKVLFGRNHKNSEPDKLFRKVFPTIHNFIKLYKSEKEDYRVLSHTLQRMESEFIFKNLVYKIVIINPDIKIITVHDSIIVQKKYQILVENLFQSCLIDTFGN